MTEKAFARALWVQAFAAGAALALSAASPGTLGTLMALGTLAAIVLRLLGKRLTRTMESAVAILSCAFVPIDIAINDFELAPALARFLLILQLAKLLGPRERRDEGTILVVALVHIAVAASSTIEPIFAPLVLIYGASAAYSLALRQLRGPDLAAPANPPVALSFRAAFATLGVLAVAIGTAIFFVIPRVGAKLLPIPRASNDRVSGYSDTIALDDAGRIRQSGNRAFRVDVVQRGKLPASPYWRGQALVVYDGATWVPLRFGDRIGHEFGLRNGVYDMELGPAPRDATIVEIYLEPMQSQTLFTPGLAHTVEYKTPGPPLVNRDAFSTVLSYWYNARPTAYRLTCVPTEVFPDSYTDHSRRPQNLSPAKVRDLCLGLPKTKLDVTRLQSYASTVLKNEGVDRGSTLAKARTLSEHLSNNFKYTLDAKRNTGVERVTDFLFTTKEGHCEVFAGTLAVLLRAMKIPSRVVNGFRGGEYHSWTDNYTVLDRHAHAWVEALCEDGWVTLDPTPAGALDDLTRSGFVATFEDLKMWCEIRWFKNVVAFDMNDQFHLLRDAKEWFGPALDAVKDALWRAQHSKDEMKLLVALLAFGLVLGTAVATIGPRRIAAGFHALVADLRDLLRRRTRAELAARELEPVVRALEKLGVRRAPGETARELADAALAKLGDRARPFERIVPIYYAARYGGRELTAQERGAIREAARALEG